LAITRRPALLMGGEVVVESRPGGGSVFWFSGRFRRFDGASTVGAADDAASRATLDIPAGRRILLAEDQPINREVASALLERLGFVVDVAQDGHEAVARVGAALYDAVPMDIQMPGMDGLDATRFIRALPGWAEVPIIAITANAFEQDRQPARRGAYPLRLPSSCGGFRLTCRDQKWNPNPKNMVCMPTKAMLFTASPRRIRTIGTMVRTWTARFSQTVW
jgi:CheY-like chemotaxis protein